MITTSYKILRNMSTGFLDLHPKLEMNANISTPTPDFLLGAPLRLCGFVVDALAVSKVVVRPLEL